MGTRKLPRVLNQKSARALLESDGWIKTIGGKHSVKMEKDGHRPITLPMHNGDDYGPGLTSAILRQSGLKVAGESDEVQDTSVAGVPDRDER